MSPLFRKRGSGRATGSEGPDERIYGRHYTGPSPWLIGAVVAVIAVVLTYLVFSKNIPFTGAGYELNATFASAPTLAADSPVRIAGVNVGKVTSVEPSGEGTRVTFTVDEQGRPIHTDAEIQIRPRLFLEGNWFLDLQPGSPSASELGSGDTIPVTQTYNSVQLDEVLTALQSDSRRDLSALLKGFGAALNAEPTAEEDAAQTPETRGETGAQAINDSFTYGASASRDTAIVNTALLGTKPHDLSRLIASTSRVFKKLDSRDQQLKGLITNFNVFTGALASESDNLQATLAELAPTLEQAQPSLANLSDALPPVRTLAIELEPGVAELGPTIRAGLPWLQQTNKLLGDRELGGLARLLANATPGLAKTTRASLQLFPQIDDLSRCTTKVLLPTGDIVIDDDGGAYPFSTGQSNFHELFYGFVDLAGESQAFDGNGQMVRFQTGGGPTLAQASYPANNSIIAGNNISDPLGTRPTFSSTTPPFRFDVPCHQNAIPDVNGTGGVGLPGDVGPPMPEAVP